MHVLGDRHGLHAARVADGDAAREQLGQAQRLDRDRRRVHPPQLRRLRELVVLQDPRVGDIAVGEALGALLGESWRG